MHPAVLPARIASTRTASRRPLSEIIAINEVDPATGTSLFEMHMSGSLGLFQSYRVYLLPEDQVAPPLNLP